MEKLIYVNVMRLGESIKDKDSMFAGYKDATNDWYVIKAGSDGGGGVEISRVFEDVEQLNHPDMALIDSGCEVIGSRIYMISGLNATCDEWWLNNANGSGKIRYIDTLNPNDGWKTCFTLPFTRGGGKSALIDGRWLYLFAGNHPQGVRNKNPWCYVVDVDESKEIERERGGEITPLGSSAHRPLFCACLSPGTFVCYMGADGKMFQLDCENNTWTSYEINFPFDPLKLYLCCTVFDDGILYLYDSVNLLLTSYDLCNRKELSVVELPPSFLFGRYREVQLIVLSRNRFCIISHIYGDSLNETLVYYTRFSVSHDPPKPTVEIEEQEGFLVGGYRVLNVVAVASSDATDATNMSAQPHAGNSSQSHDLTSLTTVHQFDGKNYLQWSLSFLLFIRGQGREDYINGRLTPPASSNAKYATWRDENKHVMAWLVNSMTLDIRKNFMKYMTAREIWVAACKLYSSTSDVVVPFLISGKLHELNQGTMTVTVYYNILTQLWQLIDLYDSHVWTTLADARYHKKKVEMDRINKFLSGLNPEYEEVRSKILRSSSIPSIREVFSTVKQEESRKVTRKGGKFICSNCNKKGHNRDTCWKIHGRPSQDKKNWRNERCGCAAIDKEEHPPNLDELIRKLLNDHEKYLE